MLVAFLILLRASEYEGTGLAIFVDTWNLKLLRYLDW